MHDRVKVALVVLLALPLPAAAQVPEAAAPNLDQLVSGLSPTIQFIINGVVLAVAVAAGLLSYFKKGKATAAATPAHDLSAQVVGGALADRTSMQDLASAIRGLTEVIKKGQAQEAERAAKEGLEEQIAEAVEERLRALESPAPTRRPPK